jgi:hypothetical protein
MWQNVKWFTYADQYQINVHVGNVQFAEISLNPFTIYTSTESFQIF